MSEFIFKRFIDQEKPDCDYINYTAGRICCDSSKGSKYFLISGQMHGAEDTFSIGQPIYDKDNNLMGYLKIGLCDNLNYTGIYNGEKYHLSVGRLETQQSIVFKASKFLHIGKDGGLNYIK